MLHYIELKLGACDAEAQVLGGPKSCQLCIQMVTFVLILYDGDETPVAEL